MQQSEAPSEVQRGEPDRVFSLVASDGFPLGACLYSVVGHGFGAQSVGLVDELRSADAAVLFGAQLGYYGHWAGLERLGLLALWHGLVPVLTRIHGYLPGRGR